MSSTTSRPPMTAARGARRGRRAFSLIEVLIAIFVLALGLLGLGAVFPVVIREQRLGTDQTLGVNAANAAKATLQSMRPPAPNGVYFTSFWQVYREQLRQSFPTNVEYTQYLDGFWTVPPVINNPTVYTGTRNVTLLRAQPPDGIGFTVPPRVDFEIPMTARLYPQSAPGGSEPQMFWDIAVQRVVDGDLRARDPIQRHRLSVDDELRVAIFVRRLDPRLRPPAQQTLVESITTGNQRVPAGIQNNVPTRDGTGDYAGLRTASVRFLAAEAITPQDERRLRNRLYIGTDNPTGNQDPWPLLAQVGQRLVDNLGNIYTVTGSGGTGGQRYVTVSPEVPMSVHRSDFEQVGPAASALADIDALRIRQVVFAPQPPVAVTLWRIRP